MIMSESCTLVFLLALVGALVLQFDVVSPQVPVKPNLVSDECDYNNSTGGTSNEYKSNVVALMADLKKGSASQLSNYTTTAGTGANKVYGQYYCRGDIGSDLCDQCVQEASSAPCVADNLSNKTVVWYEECTLRYDNKSMDGVLELDTNLPWPAIVYYHNSRFSLLNVTDTKEFDRALNTTVEELIKLALDLDGCATGEQEMFMSDTMYTLYCLVQCSPDLSPTQCVECLRAAYKFLKVPAGDKWSRSRGMYYTSCQLRYSNIAAFYPYYDPHIRPDTTGMDSSYYVKVILIAAAAVGLIFIVGVSFCLIKRRSVFSFKRQHVASENILEDGYEESDMRNMECVYFDLKTIEDATNGFSISNILGQGGFGMVYQGVLKDGQDIAVKRLSKSSGQGTIEFKTEVAVVANLQHKNLVRLVGCCVDGVERLLVYEFLRNLSLDSFLYDATKSTYLTWDIRHKIIQGITRGLHYLHEDSRVKIVHRDLKISNILLDDNLDPKIADFGLAKLVMVDQTSNHTARVVGTYGYMSPEYALTGRYSTKSDVYSFGVIVLEILSGKICSRFYEISQGEGLLNYAWRVWNEGTIEKLMDPVVQNNYSRTEAERCLQIGLLCVQDDEANRPPMHAVLVMLISNNTEIPPPLTPSHSSYINKLSLGDTTEERTSNQHVTGSTKSSITYSLNEAETR